MPFNFMAAVTVCSDSGAQENKICHCSTFPPPICHEVMGPDTMIFNPVLSLSSFTLIKRLFNSSLSVIRVASSTYLRLLIFLLAILILAYDSFILAFPMMYSACKLNKQGDNIQPYRTPTSELSHVWF